MASSTNLTKKLSNSSNRTGRSWPLSIVLSYVLTLIFWNHWKNRRPKETWWILSLWRHYLPKYRKLMITSIRQEFIGGRSTSLFSCKSNNISANNDFYIRVCHQYQISRAGSIMVKLVIADGESIINQLCLIGDEYYLSMIFRGLRLFLPKFGTRYSQAMYEAWKANPNEVHNDWDSVFRSQERESHVNVGSPEHLEREKSLALSAYMLIRYYKTRGHEEAVLDPLSISPPMQDWSTSRSSARSMSRTNWITTCSTIRSCTINT